MSPSAAPSPAAPEPSVPVAGDVPVRVVGIAASAGGIEALRELLEGLPPSDRLSLVVAQHGSPSLPSALSELLAPHARLRVATLQDGDPAQPGTVAIVPARQDAEWVDGRFRLVEPLPVAGARPSADRLFRSLADGLGDAAVGIVLSGTGSDGAAGIGAIRAVGGLTIAQDPSTAQHDGMPKAAIHGGEVDLVLRPGEIGATLLRLASGTGELVVPDGDRDLYAQIAHLVRVRTAFRLDEYKPATVRRRVARRLGLLNLPSLAAYVAHLRATPDEARQLVRDTFVSVTAFFRDGGAWDALEHTIGRLVAGAAPGVLRCWVPGCATGEEAYGIAMLFEEALRLGQRADLQYMVFASDLDDDALDQARKASYASSALSALPEPLRERYVVAEGERGRVRKELRARVVFARQNVIDDPPFSRMDLISCRNLLIYLNPPVQRRVLEVFHAALRPGGRLFLGRSEALDGHADLFGPVDAPARLYERLEGFKRRVNIWRPPDASAAGALPGGAAAPAEPPSETAARRLLVQLAQRHAPPSLLLGDGNEVRHFEGAVKPFLDFPSGTAGLQLFDLVDPAIRAELRALVYRCRRDRAPVQGALHRRSVDGVPHEVSVQVEPLAHDPAGLLVVSFVARPQAPADPAAPQAPREAAIVAELERELADTREHLVIVVDELQSTNEQLQAANEEWQSANEELQSTNEELRTVNEELQSANEELLTVNEELQLKTRELEASASMLTNVKQSLDFPLLVVDRQRQVLDANQACRQLVHPEAPLLGVPVQALAWRFPIGALDDELQRVFDGGERLVRELAGDGGQQFRLHAMPYRTARQTVAGAVLLFEDVTALRGAEDRYRQVTESLPQLVWTCTAEGPCDYLSPQWVRYTGVPEAEQLGFGWLQQLHPDDRQRAIDHWTETASRGLDYEIEFRIRRHDGAYRWFHTQARPLRDARGRIVKWYGSNTDIDDRKRAERALQLATETLEQRVLVRTAELEKTSAELARALHELEDLYHNAPCGYHSIDAEGRMLRVNDTELRWLGYTRDEVIGRPITDLLAPAGRATFAANYARIRAGESLANLEVEWRRKDGSALPMLVSATPVFDDQGRYLYSRSVMQDFTELRAQQRTLRGILTAAPMAVRIARLSDHQTVFVNQAFAELVDRSIEQATGLDVRRFYADPDAYETLMRRLAAGQPVRNELVEVRRSDDPADHRWGLVSFMAIDYEGEPATLAWLFDVTELQHARRRAEEASLSKSRFLANMSHEIRTPMNGVIGMIEHARRDLSDPAQIERLDKSLTSARQLLAILNDILDLAKIEAGHARLNPAPTDLGAGLAGLQRLYDEVARQKGLVLTIDLHPALARRAVVADALRLAQVLGNLVANAIKFSARGEVRVRAAPEAEDDDGVTVRFEVSDQGSGIEPQDQARVFEMFEQADAGPGVRAPGTGLGLSISRDLVALMGGQIGLRSVPGAGSTFWFSVRLPWAASAPVQPALPAAAAAPRAARHAAARILVAEDNEINQEVMQMSLEGLGLRVDMVSDGRQAVEAAARTRYDLIFMDMRMPVMDGLEATRALRRDGRSSATPVIALTANAFEEDRQACLAAGMNDFLTKPVMHDILERTTFDWLDRSSASESP